MRRRTTLGVLLLGALALRLVAIGAPLSNDEGYTWLVVSAHGPGVLLDRLAAYENTPPLYYLLTWPLPSSGVAWLRIVPVLAGTGCVWAVWWVVRGLGATAVFAAAALAVAPFAVSYSDYARGFTLADLALLVALGAAIRRRWWLYAAAAAVALYAEYDSALFLVALSFAVGWRALPPIALLAPWLPEIIRASHATGITKVSPVYPNPSPDSLRDTIVRLTFGEHGTAHAASLRWLQFVLVAAVCVWAFRRAPRVLAITAGGTLALHAIAHWIGPDIFSPRYLTELIPIAAAALGCAVAGVEMRAAPARVAPARGVAAGGRVIAAFGAAVAVLGIAVAVKRTQGNGEPDLGATAKIILPAARNRIVLTNSAVVAYYLRDLHPRLDRPFGLGPGLEAGCSPSCRESFLIVDDLRVAGGTRAGPGTAHVIGPLYVRATPRRRAPMTQAGVALQAARTP
jgi:hypothetical protein